MTVSSAAKGRSSGIPTPGRSTTPARLRSSSSAASSLPASLSADSEAIDRAFADAVRANDPSRHSRASAAFAGSAGSSRPVSRPKTPTVSGPRRRPDSRQSGAFLRALRESEVGDSVRIESLGFEGTLCYVGEIDGKEGLWAGVELSGGFAGKGKNDGSVAGKYYFHCPPNCGVFVAFTKLSPPTVGLGAISRPTSAASSRASLTGRITPSISSTLTAASSGRVTPRSSGRVTPASSFGFQTPGSRPKSAAASRQTSNPALTTPSASAMSKITAGSRASKYIGVTAQQLSARGGVAPPSPSRPPPSPSRSAGLTGPQSSAVTPKAINKMIGLGTPRGFGGGRPSLTTPKARVPSAVAMPPPPSPPSGGSNRSISMNEKPVTPTFSSASNDTAVDDEGLTSLTSIQQTSRALQDKIHNLLPGKRTPSLGSTSPPDAGRDLLDESNAKQSMIVALQERLDAMEQENSSLRSDLDVAQVAVRKVSQLESVQLERDQAVARTAELEGQLKTTERNLKERSAKIESLERSLQTSTETLASQRAESDARLNDLQSKIDDSGRLIGSLKDAVEAKSNEAGQNEGVIQAKNAEIGLLEVRVKKACGELEEVRRDLSGQVDELRQAGQETIALYEERLSLAETKRYELEDLIEGLTEQLKRAQETAAASPEAVTGGLSEAARIDIETMREQAVHLQRRIASLEDMLEDARAAAEREEVQFRARVSRFREGEAAMKKEVADARREVENVLRAEAAAKARAEEMEEALRENTLALENARAEIEALRTEVADLEGQRAGLAASTSSRSGDASRQSRQIEEITQLRESLDAARAARKEASDALDEAKLELIEARHSTSILRQTIESLDSDKAELERLQVDMAAKLERERTAANELRAAFEQKASELDTTRKSLNRDRPLNGGALQDIASTSSTGPTTPRHDLNAAREEIKGLKHIIQELQKENAAAANQYKILDSENKLLLSETNQLREELKILEDNIEQSILHEEQALSSSAVMTPTVAAPDVYRSAKDMASKDSDIEQLRKKLAEQEMKSARTIHDLNKELSELESLVEAKIYREDELEREIERLKQKYSRDKKSKSSTEPAQPDQPQRKASTASTVSVPPLGDASQDICEICEQPGHDIFSCPVLKDGGSGSGIASKPTPSPARAVGSTGLYCEDCESHGHTAAECPYSLDVF